MKTLTTAWKPHKSWFSVVGNHLSTSPGGNTADEHERKAQDREDVAHVVVEFEPGADLRGYSIGGAKDDLS